MWRPSDPFCSDLLFCADLYVKGIVAPSIDSYSGFINANSITRKLQAINEFSFVTQDSNHTILATTLTNA